MTSIDKIKTFLVSLPLILSACEHSSMLDVTVESYRGDFSRSNAPALNTAQQGFDTLTKLNHEANEVNEAANEYNALLKKIYIPATAFFWNASSEGCKKLANLNLIENSPYWITFNESMETVALSKYNLELDIIQAKTDTLKYIDILKTKTTHTDEYYEKRINLIVSSDIASVSSTIFQTNTNALFNDVNQGLNIIINNFKVIGKDRTFDNSGVAQFCDLSIKDETVIQLIKALQSNLKEILNNLKTFDTTKSKRKFTGLDQTKTPAVTLKTFSQDAPALIHKIQNISQDINETRITTNSSMNFAISDIRSVAQKQALYTSQLDRVQDPADIAWTTLNSRPLDTKYAIDQFIKSANRDGTIDLKYFPESCAQSSGPNKPCWGEVAKTSFKAEGKSDILIVQERIGNFKIKQASNFPAALIKGQLQISRTIASGATKIIGSLAGINMPSTVKTEGSNSSNSSSQGTTVLSAFEISKKAELQSARKKVLITALHNNLKIYIETLKPDANSNLDPDQKAEIYALLKAYAIRLENKKAN